MKYTIWRVSTDGESFPLTVLGATSVKAKAMEKARNFNEKLKQSEPESTDLFVVRNDHGQDLKAE